MWLMIINKMQLEHTLALDYDEHDEVNYSSNSTVCFESAANVSCC
jgi:hypothetical protein